MSDRLLTTKVKVLYLAFFNLCINRDFIELLREEIRSVEQNAELDLVKGLRLLDCFRGAGSEDQNI